MGLINKQALKKRVAKIGLRVGVKELDLFFMLLGKKNLSVFSVLERKMLLGGKKNIKKEDLDEVFLIF